MDRPFSLKITHPGLFSAAALLATGLLLVFPARLFLGDLYFAQVARTLDDKTADGTDRIIYSSETAALYQTAREYAGRAAAFMPSQARYQKTLADLHLQTVLWAKAMESMHAGSASAAIPFAGNGLDSAIAHMERAVFLDPLNPWYHEATGHLYAEQNRPFESTDREFQLASKLYPSSSALHYAIATEYLLQRQDERAFACAALLAGIDDSYRIDEDDQGSLLDREKKVPWYITRLAQSYLYRSLEIAWRASGRNPAKVAAVVPNNIDAQETAGLFFEAKGIDYNPGSLQ